LPTTPEKLGLWLVGASGNVATTVAVGLAAMHSGRARPIGLITESPACRGLHLAPFACIVLGGHEIARRTPHQTAHELADQSGLFGTELLKAVAPALRRYSQQIRPGYDPRSPRRVSAANVIARLRRDIDAFKSSQRLARVVVIHVASAEAMHDARKFPRDWRAFESMLKRRRAAAVPPSMLYALAAIEAGAAYVNFTPAVGADLPAIRARAAQRGAALMGSDAKTGESLLRSVLAPMFSDRCLDVRSWTGANLLGNRDGANLSDAKVKAAKLRSKDAILASLLSPRPDTHTAIEFVASLHDWKTAWNHIHFAGFLGTPMALQFVWQGCDSILAAPLVIDLARLADLHLRRGRSGVMSHLAAFFKAPMDSRDHHFHRQMAALHAYLDNARAEARR